jgi:RNA polymerase sigma-70 factor (ECF subfamily)
MKLNETECDCEIMALKVTAHSSAGFVEPELLEQSRAAVYRWAYRLLQNHHDALDVTQTVLLKSLSASPPQRERRFAWLRSVTCNHCIDLLRKRRPDHVDMSSAGAPSTGQSLVAAEQHDRLVVAMDRLTDIQRQVLVSKTLDERTFSEIATSLGMSVSTAKTHYLRALQRLRDVLKSAEY